MAEPFSISKAIKSFFSGLDWFKALMIGLKILGIAFIGLTIYRAYFMETQSQTQIFRGNVKQVTIRQDRKKTFIPFIEGGVEKNNQTEFETYMRAGLRFEF